MSTKKNRKKDSIIAFRVTQEENAKIEARIKFSGLQKQDYMVNRILDKPREIYYGKFECDRLGVELQFLTQELETLSKDMSKESYLVYIEIKEILTILLESRMKNYEGR